MMKLLAAALLALAAFVVPAHADATTMINVGDLYAAVAVPILQAIGGALGVLAVGFVSYGIAWLRGKLHLQTLELDAEHRDALQTAITNAAGVAINQLGNKLSSKSIDLNNAAVATAVRYVEKSAPQALAHFGLYGRTTEIAEKIVAKLPQVAVTPTPLPPQPASN